MRCHVSILLSLIMTKCALIVSKFRNLESLTNDIEYLIQTKTLRLTERILELSNYNFEDKVKRSGLARTLI